MKRLFMAALACFYFLNEAPAHSLKTSGTGLDLTNAALGENTLLTAPHPAAVAYREAQELLNSDPAAARRKAEEALELLGDDAPAEDYLEVRTLIALAGLLADQEDRSRAKELESVLKEREEAGMQETALSARSWLALCGFSLIKDEWRELGEYAARAEAAILAVAPNAIDPRAVAITYQGISRFKRHDPSDTSAVPKRRRKAIESRAQETIAIFERGITLYPVQESWEKFNRNLAILIAWRATAINWYSNGDAEGARKFFNSRNNPSLRFPKREMSWDQCGIEWLDRPAPEYPEKALQKGYVGATVIVYDLTPEGRVTNARPLASVPDSYFAPAALNSMENWHAKVDPGTPPECLKGWVVWIAFQFE